MPQLSCTTFKNKQTNKKSPLECLGAFLTHSIGMKNCALQGLHWVGGHPIFTYNKIIKPTRPFHTNYDHRILRASQTNRDNIFSLLYQCNFGLTIHFFFKPWVLSCKGASSWQSSLTEVILHVLKYIKP